MISKMREVRFFSQMTLQDLSIKTKISLLKLSLIERGIAATEKEKSKIARALKSNVKELFPNS